MTSGWREPSIPFIMCEVNATGLDPGFLPAYMSPDLNTLFFSFRSALMSVLTKGLLLGKQQTVTGVHTDVSVLKQSIYLLTK